MPNMGNWFGGSRDWRETGADLFAPALSWEGMSKRLNTAMEQLCREKRVFAGWEEDLRAGEIDALWLCHRGPSRLVVCNRDRPAPVGSISLVQPVEWAVIVETGWPQLWRTA